MKSTIMVIALASITATAAHADTWVLNSDASHLAFGSIKNDYNAEVHSFSGLTGGATDTAVTVSIDLASVQTNIDIRNERMTKHVFQDGKATAVITGNIDMDAVNSLKPGETKIVELEALLNFAGVEAELETEMLVARLSENRVLVTTADFLMLSTEDLEIDAGIDALMKLAELPQITRVTPVSVRMVFQK